jgi:hypothetical protein
MTAYDENGWWMGALAPLPVSDCYSLLAPEDDSRLDRDRLQHPDMRFFRIELTLLTAKQYPGGGWPRADRAELEVSGPGHPPERVEVYTLPLDRAPDAQAGAREAAAKIGAGFDALVKRAVRLWQIPDTGPAASAAALVLASVLLAPILPPGGRDIYGVKTGRARLGALGWPT